MTRCPQADRRDAVTGPVAVVSLLVAWSFAVTGPLLDLLGRYPQFFAVRGVSSVQLLALSAGIALLAPFALAGAVVVVRHWFPMTGSLLWEVLLTSLVGSFALVVLRRSLAADPSVAATAAGLGIALVCGISGTLLVRTSSAARTFFVLLGPAPIVMLAVFLLVTPASLLLGSAGAVTPQGVLIGNTAPVVILVYDELPLVALLDAAGRIDPGIFPNFARLAAHATLYRNTTTASDDTTWAIPALLSGLYPERPGRLPIPADHPHTLFTLLRGAYSISCLEPVTRLCPAAARASFGAERDGSWSAMLSDLRILWLHLVLPARLAAALPPVDQGWTHFADAATEGEAVETQRVLSLEEIVAVAESDRRAQFSAFLQSMESTSEPTFHFGHLLLPHKPYRYLPGGRRYVRKTQPDPFNVGGPWSDTSWAKVHERQRHQLQADYVDISLGDLLDRLQATGRYEDTLLVVTADHGVAFVPGADRRIAEPETLGEIAWVPLFVKRPHQRQGELSERPMRLIDVLPLVAQILHVELPWRVDGNAAGAIAEPVSRRLLSPLGGDFELPLSTEELDRALERKAALFGSSPGVKRHYEIGEDGDLVGRRVSELPRVDRSRFRARYDRPGELRRVALVGTGFLPAYLGGDLELSGDGETTTELHGPRLAAALNGRIAGVGRATPTPSGRMRFAIFLWPEIFRRGRNDLELFEIRGTSDDVELAPRMLSSIPSASR